VIILLCIVSGCAQKHSREELPEIVRKYERFACKQESIAIDSRTVFVQVYVPLYMYNGRGGEQVSIRTYEFNDSSLSITKGFSDCPMGMIALDAGDRFYLFSVDKARLEQSSEAILVGVYLEIAEKSKGESVAPFDEKVIEYESFKRLECYLELAEICKGLPKAHFDENGIVKEQRDSEWVAVFKKEYMQTGVRLKAINSQYPFMYNVSYLPLEELPNTERSSREVAKKRLPPFLIHSFKDFIKYFGPSGDFTKIIKDNYGS